MLRKMVMLPRCDLKLVNLISMPRVGYETAIQSSRKWTYRSSQTAVNPQPSSGCEPCQRKYTNNDVCSSDGYFPSLMYPYYTLLPTSLGMYCHLAFRCTTFYRSTGYSISLLLSSFSPLPHTNTTFITVLLCFSITWIPIYSHIPPIPHHPLIYILFSLIHSHIHQHPHTHHPSTHTFPPIFPSPYTLTTLPLHIYIPPFPLLPPPLTTTVYLPYYPTSGV